MRLARRDEPVGADTPVQSRERQLWCAVVGRALEDALGQPGGIAGTTARRRAVDEARDWFVRNGDDFRRVCDAAGYEPDLLRRRALKLIAENGAGLLPSADAAGASCAGPG